MQKKTIIFLLLILIAFKAVPARAESRSEKDNAGFLPGLKENLIFKKEIILSGSRSDERDETSGKNSIGFEALKRFSGKRGDWGSALVQLRVVRYDNYYMLMNAAKMPPAHVDDMHDWELELHDAYFRYTGSFKGRYNFRIGHFDVPYGLEENVDTHSTLIQLMAMRNIGFKKDWGISMGGQFPGFDYNAALTRGAGIEYRNKNENYLLSARIGTPADENLSIGFSVLYGEVIDPMGVMRGMAMGGMGAPKRWFGRTARPEDNIINRWRMGIDSIYLYGPFTFKGEVSLGEDVNQDVVNSLLETDYLFPDMQDRLEAVAQIQGAYQDITASGSDHDMFLTLGLNYKISSAITLQAVYRHDFQRLKHTANEDVIALQCYCYF